MVFQREVKIMRKRIETLNPFSSKREDLVGTRASEVPRAKYWRAAGEEQSENRRGLSYIDCILESCAVNLSMQFNSEVSTGADKK
jgi:hypothetical protein